MQTDELRDLALDFAHRVGDLPWLTDGLLVVGMLPSASPHDSPGTRTVRDHVILIGPTGDEPPQLPEIVRTERSGNMWIRVWPLLAGVIDEEKLITALATCPVPAPGKEFNFIGVHFTRRRESGDHVRFLFGHRPEMDETDAQEKLADDAWVHDVMSAWLDGTPR